MEILHTKLHLGAEKPFKVLHISDTHLYYSDERDDERKQSLALRRHKFFADPEACLADAVRIAREENALLVHSGDLIDFVSIPNLEAAKRFTDENDCFFAAGNHEFSLYVGEAFEDAAYRKQSLARVQACFKNDIRFASRVVNGINFVAVDNSYYLFEEWQLTRLKAECEKGLPVVLVMHTPLYAPDIADECRARRQETLSLMASPDEIVATYNDYRRRQQQADAVTKEAFSYIQNTPAIRAILTGHMHFPFESQVTPALTQYLVGTDSGRLIEID